MTPDAGDRRRLVLALAITATALTAGLLFGNPRAPLHGVMIAGLAISVLGASFWARRKAELAIAPGPAIATYIVWGLATVDPDATSAEPPCDPSCGVSIPAAVLYLAIVAFVVVAAGRALRALWHRSEALTHRTAGNGPAPGCRTEP